MLAIMEIAASRSLMRRGISWLYSGPLITPLASQWIRKVMYMLRRSYWGGSRNYDCNRSQLLLIDNCGRACARPQFDLPIQFSSSANATASSSDIFCPSSYASENATSPISARQAAVILSTSACSRRGRVWSISLRVVSAQPIGRVLASCLLIATYKPAVTHDKHHHIDFSDKFYCISTGKVS